MGKQEHHTETFFMRRAIELAGRGAGHVSPNPLVGCVIVHEGMIIGEGWHKEYGGPHAEVNAINSVADKTLLPKSAVYVNLEPCSHFGKTPPCADRLIEERIKKVVIANLDPNPLVAGEGIRRLRSLGVEVLTGILAGEGYDLNARFFTYMEKRRPHIILKWAQTSDGFIARENFDARWISSALSRKLVHKWRTEEDSILVGMRTAKFDNPQLNVRDWTGRNPVRIVIDRFLKLDEHLRLFDGSQPTICYNVIKSEQRRHNLSLVRLDEEGFIVKMLADLYQRKLQSVIVEGGRETLQLFSDAGLWDEARVFTSSESFHRGIAAPVIEGRLASQQQIGSDTLCCFVNPVQTNHRYE